MHDEAAVAHYRAVLQAALDAGVEPWVCLHHFTLPRWFADQGGFTTDENRLTHWARHVDWMAETFGDLVRGWQPINELNFYPVVAYSGTTIAPGARRLGAGRRRVRADAPRRRRGRRAPQADRRPRLVDLRPDAHRGPRRRPGHGRRGRAASTTSSGGPASSSSATACCASAAASRSSGPTWPAPTTGTGSPTTRRSACADGAWGMYPEEGPTSPLGYRIWADGLDRILRRLHARLPGQPILIAEYGVGTPDDAVRAEYLERGLAITQEALADGIDIRGFFHWTAVDNYEWNHGYDVQFGIIDRDRTVRPSAAVLRPRGAGVTRTPAGSWARSSASRRWASARRPTSPSTARSRASARRGRPRTCSTPAPSSTTAGSTCWSGARTPSAATPACPGSAWPPATTASTSTSSPSRCSTPPTTPWQAWEWPGGCEDPRVVESPDGGFVCTYTAFDGKNGAAVRGHLDRPADAGRSTARRSPARPFAKRTSKSGAVLTEVVDGRLVAARRDGRFWMYWGEGTCFAATSDGPDPLGARHLRRHRRPLPHLRPRDARAGASSGSPASRCCARSCSPARAASTRCSSSRARPPSPPTPAPSSSTTAPTTGRTATRRSRRSRTSRARPCSTPLDPLAPIARTTEPFLRPDQADEQQGQVDNVCFAQGLVRFRDRWHLYYGMADSRIGLATAPAR